MSHHIRRFAPSDRDAMLAFAQGLSEHDLLFLGQSPAFFSLVNKLANEADSVKRGF